MTSRHASGAGRRGVASWIIVTIVAVVLVSGAAVAYFLIIDDSGESAADCASQVQLPVVAAPGAAAAVTAAAGAFDATGPVARSACVSTAVTTLPNAQAELALADDWQQAAGTAPAIWVPDSEASLHALESTDSAMTAGRDTSPIAASPVVIAVRDADAASTTAAGLSWPGLTAATGPDGTVTTPSGQHLILALPSPSTNRATSYALQSVLAGSGAPVDVAAVTANAAELATLGAGGPGVQPATTEQALTELVEGTGTFTAVPVVASDLAAFSAATPGLTGIAPTGTAVGDTVYPVPLAASWVTPTLEDAGALFLAYLRSPEGVAAFADHGYQVAGSTPATGSGSASSAPVAAPGAVAGDAGPEVAAALAAAIGSTPAG